MTASSTPHNDQIDVNAVVSYNLRVIRERRGMTQQQVADALAQYSGHRLPQASISAMERGFAGARRRRFDAHEIYLLSVVFGVPIIYLLLPPPGEARRLAGTGRPIHELYAAVLGREHQLTDLDDRLAGLTDLDNVVAVSADLVGNARPAAPTWRDDYRTWRAQRLAQITRTYDGLDEAAHVLGRFLDQVRRVGIRNFVAAAEEDHDHG